MNRRLFLTTPILPVTNLKTDATKAVSAEGATIQTEGIMQYVSKNGKLKLIQRIVDQEDIVEIKQRVHWRDPVTDATMTKGFSTMYILESKDI